MTHRRAVARLARLWPLLPLVAGPDWLMTRQRWVTEIRRLADADGDERARTAERLLSLAGELPHSTALPGGAGVSRPDGGGAPSCGGDPSWEDAVRALVAAAGPGEMFDRASLAVLEEAGPYSSGLRVTDTLVAAGVAAALGLPAGAPGADGLGERLSDPELLGARPSVLDGRVPRMVPWADPLPWLRDSPDATHWLADTWQLRPGPGIRLLLGHGTPCPGAEAAAALSLGTRVDSVLHTTRADPSALPRWSWPVRLAVPPGPDAAAAVRRGLLAAAEARSGLIAPVPAAGRWSRPSLLLLPHAPGHPLPDLPHGPPATAVVVVSASPQPVPSAEELRSLAGRHRCAVAAWAHCGPSARRWLEALLDGLAQDLPLDLALYGAARDCEVFSPVVVADPRFLDSTRIRPVLAALPPDTAEPAARVRVGRALRGGSPSDRAGLAPQAADDLRAWVRRARRTPDRFLRAGVTGPDGTDPAGGIAPHSVFHVRVLIAAGPGATREQPGFPADALPPGPSHRLRVVASDLAPGTGRAVTEETELPGDGDSAPVVLPFVAGAEGAEIRIRIAVLYESRLLQSGLLSGRVGAPGPPEFHVDSVPRAHTDELDLARPHDAALLVDRATDGRTVVTTSTAWFVHSSLIRDPRRTLRKLLRGLRKLNDGMDGYDSPRFAELMTDLARSGRGLAKILFPKDEWNGRGRVRELRAARSITVSSATSDMILPLEFVYDRELAAGPGRGLGLCPHAPSLVEADDGCAGCPRRGDPATVCPFGFWGASKVIERHVVRGSDASGYVLATTPGPDRHSVPLVPVCAAASERADHNDVHAWTTAATALTAQGPRSVRLAADWARLEALVTELRAQHTPPGAVLLFPHSEEDDGVLVLSLGEGDTIDVRDGLEFLFSDDGGPQPLVLLLGCATAGGDTEFCDASGMLLIDGAPGVVATAVPVQGRHIVPVGVRLLAELRKAASEPSGSPLGKALLRSRRKLLTRGDACVLALVGFGDTDWEATT